MDSTPMGKHRETQQLHSRGWFRNVLLCCAGCTVVFLNADPALAADPHPLKPADTSNPRATLQSFLDNINEVYRLFGDQGEKADHSRMMIVRLRATRCLDSSKIDPAAAEDVAEKRAVLLSEIFDRIQLPGMNTVPDAAEVEEKKITRWRIPDTEISIVEITTGPRQGEFLFSSDTVARIPEFHDRVKHLPYKPGTVLKGAFEKLFTTTPPPQREDDPLKPADVSSPQATLKSFIDSMNTVYRTYKVETKGSRGNQQQRENASRALRCLNLSKVPVNALVETGNQSAVLLMEVLDRIRIPPYEAIPGLEEVKKGNVSSWTIPSTEITVARVEEGPRKGDFLFSPETVSRTKAFYEQVKHLPYKSGTVLEHAYDVYLQSPGPMIPIAWVIAMPPWLRVLVLGQPAWKWLGLIVILLLLMGGLGFVSRFSGKPSADSPDASFRRRLILPLGGLGLAMLGAFAVEQLRVVQHVSFLISILFTILTAIFIAWLVGMINNALAEVIVRLPRLDLRGIDAQLVRIAFRLWCATQKLVQVV